MKFAISTILYTGKDNGQYVWSNDRVLGYCFINTGNCAIQLNKFILQPGGVLKTLETGMVDTTRWQILFDTFSACSTTNAELTALIYESR
jgi:hypothetical protein